MQLALQVDKQDFLPHQYEFLKATDPIIALVSGLGAGKTYGFLRKTLIQHICNVRDDNNKSNGLILYPTLPLAKELFVEDFKELLDNYNIPFKFSEKYNIFTSQYGSLRIYTLEEPNKIVGSNLTYVGIDEFDTVKMSKALECFKKSLARLRGNKTTQLFIVTTPEGFKATYHLFIEKASKLKRLIRAKTEDNLYLPPNYIALLKEEYDETLLKAYLKGEFVNLTSGNVYYAFDRDKHVRKEDAVIMNNYPLNFCFDFNVFPYCVSWNQVLNDENIIFLGEWVSKRHSNTEEACLEIIKKVPRDIDVVVYGDASGRNGSASSNITNYQIIDNIFKNYFRSVKYKVPNANPSVRDRVNCTNAKLAKNHVTFNKSCVKLVQDYEQVVWNEKAKEIDKSNILLTHFTDGNGYFYWVEYPILNFRKKTFTKSY